MTDDIQYTSSYWINILFPFLYIFRKISAHEFERGGLLKPIVNTIDGTPTFLSIAPLNDSIGTGGSHTNGTAHMMHNGRPIRLSRNELKQLDERELIFELVSKYLC